MSIRPDMEDLANDLGCAPNPAQRMVEIAFRKSESDQMIGDCRADYSLPTEAEIAAENADLTELYNRSKRVEFMALAKRGHCSVKVAINSALNAWLGKV